MVRQVASGDIDGGWLVALGLSCFVSVDVDREMACTITIVSPSRVKFSGCDALFLRGVATGTAGADGKALAYWFACSPYAFRAEVMREQYFIACALLLASIHLNEISMCPVFALLLTLPRQETGSARSGSSQSLSPDLIA